MERPLKTPAELRRYVAENIEQEGFHAALVDYTSPDYEHADKIDPQLSVLWREYLILVKKIEDHVGLRNG